MITFYPDGYIPAKEAVRVAVPFLFPEQIAATLERIGASEMECDNCIDAAIRASRQTQVLVEALRREHYEIVSQTVDRLRNSLHQGTLRAYYFETDGRHSIPRELWATANANGAIELGAISPFGRFFLLQSELNVLLSDQPHKKRPLPKSKMPELVAALRKLEGLRNRAAQLEALRDMPEFRQVTITHAVFREAARKAGSRQPGRKSGRQS